MTSITTAAAHQAIVDMFETMNLDGYIRQPEALMDGFLCQAEFDDIGELGTTEKGVRISEGETKEYRRWHSVLGRVSKDGWNFAFQGEWGTYGPFTETDDILRLQVWTGRCEVPGDVWHGFTLQHDTIIAKAAVVRLYVAAEALAHVSDEALVSADPGAITTIVEQVGRLSKAV